MSCLWMETLAIRTYTRVDRGNTIKIELVKTIQHRNWIAASILPNVYRVTAVGSAISAHGDTNTLLRNTIANLNVHILEDKVEHFS